MSENIRVEECEECSNQDVLYDAILDGKAKRLCKKCLITSDAIEIKKPKKINEQISGRPSVREMLMKMSGLKKEKEMPDLKEGLEPSSDKSEITLNDLIERKRQKDKEQKEAQAIAQATQAQTEKRQEQQQKEEQPKQQRQQKQEFAPTPKSFDFSISASKKLKIGDLLKFKRQQVQNYEEKIREEEVTSGEE